MILFWFREAFRIIKRAKSTFLISVLTLTIPIILIAASLYSILLSQKIEKKIKEQFILNIFISDSVSFVSSESIQNELENKEYVSSVKYISKEQAADIFIKETGEDFRKLLDYNPIPASFTLKLKSEYVDKDSINHIKSEISSLPGIEEILFEQELLTKIVSFLEKSQKYVFILTAVLILVSIYITYTSINFIIALRQDELETMKLVGAKLSAIKMPILLNEFLNGLFAGVISIALIKYVFHLIVKYNPSFEQYLPSANQLLLILMIGPLISFSISVFVLRKISLKI